MTVHTVPQHPATIEFTSAKTSCRIVFFSAVLLTDASFYICVRRKTQIIDLLTAFFPFKRQHHIGLKRQAGLAHEWDLSEEIPEPVIPGELALL